MNKLAFLMITLAFNVPCYAQDASKTPVVATTKTVTITGTIKNFDEFKAAVVPGTTYIQLVPMSATGSFQTLWGTYGPIAYVSDLPRLPVPTTAAFRFNIGNIPSGKYLIAAQNLKAATYGRIPNAFLVDEKRVFLIDVKADSPSPYTINAGGLIVWTH